MKFDWSGFTADDFVDYCARMENSMEYADNYIGNVRVGELCFDLVLRDYEGNGTLVLTYDLYVGGVDSGYGYSRIDEGYPYDYAEGSDFDDTCISIPYDEFQKIAETAFRNYIKWYNQSGAAYGTYSDLNEKAEAPLHVW